MTLPWIERAPGAPYFVTDTGETWTPIGQNDAIDWVELNGLYRRRDLPSVERHLRWLRENGVTTLRLMLEYAHKNHRYFEKPVGHWNPRMVQLWDDMFAMCEQVGMRILLTPFDTFFTWVRWAKHPYNKAHGGPCPSRTKLLVHAKTRDAIKARIAFAAERWGGSGALFAWDLWNEMHPAQGNNEPDCFTNFIDDVSPFLREIETRVHGRAHLQCVSVFGPELGWKPWLNEPIFRHPLLDFANSHFYEEGTIDNPRDTVAPALAAGRLTAEALSEITDQRPFFDSEHGPIHTFKDRKMVLPAAFDDEYFRHIQWAHAASGGAGGGMRWPNRRPHTLTPGMRRAQHALSEFLPLMDWPRFHRRNITSEIVVSDPDVAAFACADRAQALLWLLRQRPLLLDGRVDPGNSAPVDVVVPGLGPGHVTATLWDTREGAAAPAAATRDPNGGVRVDVPALTGDVAIAVRVG